MTLTTAPWSNHYGLLADPGSAHLDLLFDKAKHFPAVSQPENFTSARLWQCKYQTLGPLAAFKNLRALEIMVYPDETLDPVSALVDLEELWIMHLPRVSSLQPLIDLVALRRLTLATLPSWDASSKATTVESLAPIAELPALEELELFGVRPPDRRVDDLLRMRTLKRVRLLKFPRSEISRMEAFVAGAPSQSAGA